jgi:hypothetical protein
MADQKQLKIEENSERNEEVLHRIKEERNILHAIKKRKANWIGHIFRSNCLLKHVTERKKEWK